MEVDEKPTEDYNDIGGLEKQVFIYFKDLMMKTLVRMVTILLLCK